MKLARVPICFNVIGLGWAGPLILDKGTEYEREKYLKGILNAEDIWCQGFLRAQSWLGSGQHPDQGGARRLRLYNQWQQNLDHHGQLCQVHDSAGPHRGPG